MSSVDPAQAQAVNQQQQQSDMETLVEKEKNHEFNSAIDLAKSAIDSSKI